MGQSNPEEKISTPEEDVIPIKFVITQRFSPIPTARWLADRNSLYFCVATVALNNISICAESDP